MIFQDTYDTPAPASSMLTGDYMFTGQFPISIKLEKADGLCKAAGMVASTSGEGVDRIQAGVAATLGLGGKQCQYCSKVFGRKDHKVRHEKIHTGVKPYKCEHCDKCYRRNVYMDAHVWSVSQRIAPYYKLDILKLYTMERSCTGVLCVTKFMVRVGTLASTFGLYTYLWSTYGNPNKTCSIIITLSLIYTASGSVTRLLSGRSIPNTRFWWGVEQLELSGSIWV